MSKLPRRSVLRLLGVAVAGTSAGCASLPFSGDNNDSENTEHGPGTLVAINKHSLPHIIEVSVIGPKSVERKNVSSEVRKVVEIGLEGQIPIDAGETKVYSDFLSGSVMYTVKIRLDSNEVQTAKFSPAAINKLEARGAYLTVKIKQTGVLNWHTTFLH